MQILNRCQNKTRCCFYWHLDSFYMCFSSVTRKLSSYLRKSEIIRYSRKRRYRKDSNDGKDNDEFTLIILRSKECLLKFPENLRGICSFLNHLKPFKHGNQKQHEWENFKTRREI